MAIRTTSKTIARLFPMADLSGLPTTNPGSGKPWNNSGFLSIGAASAPAADSAVVHIEGPERITGQKTFDMTAYNGGIAVVVPIDVANFNAIGVSGPLETFSRVAMGLDSGTPYVGFGPGGGSTRDVFFKRYATGPALQVNAAGGLRVQNLSGTADAPLTVGNVTTSGRVSSASTLIFNAVAYQLRNQFDTAMAAVTMGALTAGGDNDLLAHRLSNLFVVSGNSNDVTLSCLQNAGSPINVNSTFVVKQGLTFNSNLAGNVKLTASGTTLQVKTSDLSADAPITVSNLTASGYLENALGYFQGNATTGFKLKAESGQALSVQNYGGTDYANLKAKSGIFSGPVYVKSASDGGTGADFYVVGNSRLAGNLAAQSFIALQNTLSVEALRISESSNFATIAASASGYALQLKGNGGGVRVGNATGAFEFYPESSSQLGIRTATYGSTSLGAFADLILNAGTFGGTVRIGATVPWSIKEITDPANPAVTALEIAPTATSKRLYFGNSTNKAFSLNFANVNSFENAPSILFNDGLTIGNANAGIVITRELATDAMVFSDGTPSSTGGFKWYTGPTYSGYAVDQTLKMYLKKDGTLELSGKASISVAAGVVPLNLRVNDLVTNVLSATNSADQLVFSIEQLTGAEAQLRLGASAGGATLKSKTGSISSSSLNADFEISSGPTKGQFGFQGNFGGRYLQFFAVGNSFVSLDGTNKGVGIGASYLSTALPVNGLAVQGNVGVGTSSPAEYAGWTNGRVMHVYDATASLPHIRLQTAANNGLFGMDGSGLHLETNLTSIVQVLNSQYSRIYCSAAQRFVYQVFDTSLAAWQETSRHEASASGALWGVFGKGALQQTGGLMTAGAAYGANEQQMIQTLWDMARTFGFLS